MESPPILTDVSLTINLTHATADQAVAGAQSLIPLLRRLDLPSTWIIDQAALARTLEAHKLAQTDFELALAVTARSPQRLRSELVNLQAAAQEALGKEASAVAGDAQQLRSRASVLAELGIVAVVSDSRGPEAGKPPRVLPCGLWQFDATLSFPQPRGIWSLLPPRQPSVKKLLGAELAGNPQLVALDVGQLSRRDLQGCASMLSQIAAAQQQQLRVANVSDLAAELNIRHQVKPQRSILRRAA